jgi:glycosyltransferase involved in cell wall biosynthesis
MNTLVLIPAYNESKKIGAVIREVKKVGFEVVVVDDGSTDGTSAVATDEGAVVLRNDANKGKGASLARGFAHALARGFDAVITMDGDGQHDPAEISLFIAQALRSPSGMVIGNRMSCTGLMPCTRRITNRCMSWLLSKFAHQHIPDTQCGFRLIKKEVLEKLTLRTCNFDTESEIILCASRMGAKVDSIPVKTVYRDAKSHINPCVDTVRFLKFLTREIIFSTRHTHLSP